MILILYILLVMWWRWAVECLCLICEFYLLVGMVCILLPCPILCDPDPVHFSGSISPTLYLPF